jgi:hypothetical protein
LDLAVPLKMIMVKEGGVLPLFLRPETLALMAKRDSLGHGPRYKAVRNKVTAMVWRDKEMSDLAKLSKSGNSPTVLWEIANAAVGKSCQPLPASVRKADGTDKKGNLEAANVVNLYYVEKVRKFVPAGESRTALERALQGPGAEIRGNKFPSPFGFAIAGRISKVITGPKNTSALGTDGIPVAVLNMGSDTLA